VATPRETESSGEDYFLYTQIKSVRQQRHQYLHATENLILCTKKAGVVLKVLNHKIFHFFLYEYLIGNFCRGSDSFNIFCTSFLCLKIYENVFITSSKSV
jgi:hypothetical protein